MREERTQIMSDILARAAAGTSVNKKPTAPVNQPRTEKEPVRDTIYWIKRWADQAVQRKMEAATTSRASEQASGPMPRIGDDPEMVRMIRKLAMEGKKVKYVLRKEGARPMKMKRKVFMKPDPSLVLTESGHSETEAEEEEESTKSVQPREMPQKKGILKLSSTSQEGATLAQWRTMVKGVKKKIGVAAATRKAMRKSPPVRRVPFADETTTTPQNSLALQATLLRQRLDALNQRLFDSATQPLHEEPSFNKNEDERVEPAVSKPQVEKEASKTTRRANIDVNQPPEADEFTASESEEEADREPEPTNAETEEIPPKPTRDRSREKELVIEEEEEADPEQANKERTRKAKMPMKESILPCKKLKLSRFLGTRIRSPDGRDDETFMPDESSDDFDTSFSASHEDGYRMTLPRFYVDVQPGILEEMSRFDDSRLQSKLELRLKKGKEYKCGQVVDFNTLDAMNVHDEFFDLLDKIGVVWLLDVNETSVPCVVANEFFTSFRFDVTHDLDVNSIHFRLFGEEYEMSLTSFCIRLSLMMHLSMNLGVGRLVSRVCMLVLILSRHGVS